MKKKVLFLLNDAPFFISHRLPIAEAALSAGFEVHVAAPHHDKSIEKIISSGIIFHDVPLKRGGRSLIGELKLILFYWKMIGLIRPDLIHAVTMKPILYGGLVARLRRVPAVVHAVTGLGYLFLIDGIFANVQKYIVFSLFRIVFAHNNLRIIFQNSDDLNLFLNKKIMKNENYNIIYGCGVDLNQFKFSPEPSKPTTILFPARIIGDKGVREFVDAARIIKDKGLNAVFYIAGRMDSDNPTDIGEELLNNWQRMGWIEWKGFIKNMPEIYSSSHIICLPSYREGLPRSLIEAAACGRPIVTTDVPGCREVVQDGINGLLVPARNSEALAVAISNLINDEELRLSMGRRSREIATNRFSVQQFVEESLDVYRLVLDGHLPNEMV